MSNVFVKADVLNVRSTPGVKPDNRIDQIRKGQEVTVLNQQGGWSQISYSGGKTGWVNSKFLTDMSDDINPEARQSANTKVVDGEELPIFKIGVPNLADDTNTIRVRKIINDALTGGKNKWDLQCTEYVQFRIKQNGVEIHWPADRPRDGGRWADILERNKLYKVLDKPKAGCAVSFTAGFTGSAAKTGHVAYVEEVFPDESIHITEANWPGQGKYNDRIIAQAVWEGRHKCRFIDFS